MPALYVIRHAQPTTGGLLIGQSDPALSLHGRKQSLRLGKLIRSKGLQSLVYSSPLRRAVQTARYILRKPIVLPGLAEITYGDWDGLSWTEIEHRWPWIAREKLAGWQAVTPPGGESWDDFTGRVTAALAVVLGGPLPAVIVAHEAVNAIIANHLADKSIEDYRHSYCDIRKYEIGSSIEPPKPCAPAAGFSHQAGRESWST